MRKATVGLCFVGILFARTATILTQSVEESQIAGHVTDSSGAVLPDAAVALRHVERGSETRTATTGQGDFVFRFLLPGTYELKVERKDFAAAKVERIVLSSYQKLEINVVLRVGAPDTVISVKAPYDQIDTKSATVRDTIPQAAIEELPIITGTQSRTVLGQLQLLFPGASSFRLNGLGDAFGSTLSINGSTLGGVGFYVDGIDNSYLLGNMGGAATAGPNVDALEEVSVLTQNYGAESGGHQSEEHWRTRSGTNRLHGELRALNAYPDLRTRDFFEAQKNGGWKTNAAGAHPPLFSPSSILPARAMTSPTFCWESHSRTHREATLRSIRAVS